MVRLVQATSVTEICRIRTNIDASCFFIISVIVVIVLKIYFIDRGKQFSKIYYLSINFLNQHNFYFSTFF